METLIKTGRTCYGILMTTIGINQLIYGDFRPAILPPWPSWRTSPEIEAYITGVIFIAAGLAIVFSKKAKLVGLVLGCLLLAVILFWHLPYILFIQPHLIRHLGVWGDVGKTLAFCGGAFVVAGSFPQDQTTPGFLALPEKLIPFGRILFSTTMIMFGFDHFFYVDFISTMVPGWIPGHFFWTYVTGAALIGSGAAIVLKIKLKLVSLLLSLMIFLWFILLHIPGAIADPVVDHGNLVLSAADALGFSGTALMIALTTAQQSRANRFYQVKGGHESALP
ncbi:MAG TPA: hypothetical protein VIU12_15100 [Chryseolinea sp.]